MSSPVQPTPAILTEAPVDSDSEGEVSDSDHSAPPQRVQRILTVIYAFVKPVPHLYDVVRLCQGILLVAGGVLSRKAVIYTCLGQAG